MTVHYQLEQLSFAYGEEPALEDASLDIKQGEVIGLVGPNGAGKSTLLKLLGFLERPASGSIAYFGQRVKAEDLPQLRRRVGLVQQNPYLLRRSVTANVEIGLKLRRVERSLRIARVKQVIEQLGLGELANRRGSDLSGGEAQKVALARILVLEPEVLLLDEPFTHLDRRFLADLEQLITDIRMSQAQTIVFSSHDQLRAHLLADKVCSLVNGRLIPAPVANLFDGKLNVEQAEFDTGRIVIAVPEGSVAGQHAAVDPAHIVLSRASLHSSMRNCFEGRVIGLVDRTDQVEVRVDIGEKIEVLISHAAREDQAIDLGQPVWVSFKASAVQVF